tara:strand:- start:1292 stop:1573 length:282 start_codon:yes stop_codon:yes gene_type:complete
MPLTKNGKPILYKPWKSDSKVYKYNVYVKGDTKSGVKKIGFGRKGYDDWRSGTATKEQRKSYLARAKGIRNKQGQLTYKDKNTSNYWSITYLW